MPLPGLTWQIFFILATITGTTLNVFDAPEKVALQFTAHDEPADDKPLI